MKRICLILLLIAVFTCQSVVLAQNKVLSLNGENDSCLIVNPINNFPTTQVTVEFWMRSSNNVNEATYISYASSANSNDFLIMDSKWQSHQQNVIAHIGGLLIIDTATTINNIIWNHIAITWQSSSGVVQIFKDGSVDYSSEFPAGSVITTGGSLVIGQEQDFVGGGFDRNQAFIGEIDEVRTWNIARTQQETQITMRSSLTGQEEGLVGYWNFDDDSARDISPQGNHGEFIGDAKVVESDLVLEPIYVTPINLEPFILNDTFSLDLLSYISTDLTILPSTWALIQRS